METNTIAQLHAGQVLVDTWLNHSAFMEFILSIPKPEERDSNEEQLERYRYFILAAKHRIPCEYKDVELDVNIAITFTD